MESNTRESKALVRTWQLAGSGRMCGLICAVLVLLAFQSVLSTTAVAQVVGVPAPVATLQPAVIGFPFPFRRCSKK
jgi:hypothetical protein